ncbi:MAG: transposase [Chloroflexi bacterium]|nr:MAG: transposase [Chloroflexota bacterium]
MSGNSAYSERVSAIHLVRSGLPVSEVADQLGKSPAWVYKWRKRFFEQQNWADLQDRSRAPHGLPKQLSEEVRQAVKAARSELEAEAQQPKKLSYIGGYAVRNHLKQKGIQPLPSRASIERILSAEGLTHPRRPQEAKVVYPHLQPTQPHQLVQVDIVPRYLPDQGGCVSCFNAIDVVSRYPTGAQSLTKYSRDAIHFLLRVFQESGIPEYVQMDNESCFSGGFTHPGVIGQAVRFGLYVGAQPVFSAFRLPECNYAVERFHQDYTSNTWDKQDMPDLAHVQENSVPFYDLYRQSGHHSALNGLSPAEVHGAQAVMKVSPDFQLPTGKLPITEGKVHFIRMVQPDHTIWIANLTWTVPQAKVGEGVWATLELSGQAAKLRIFDAAPDADKRKCLVEYPFPIQESVLPLLPEFQKPVALPAAWWSLAAHFFRTTAREFLPRWLSTML